LAPPTYALLGLGVTAIETSVTCVTVSVAVPVWPPKEPVIVLVPPTTPLARPGVALDSVAFVGPLAGTGTAPHDAEDVTSPLVPSE
jgi:hypothetical protein